MKITNQAVELGQLLSSTITAVVQAQEQLDIYTESRRQAYEAAPEGSLAVPPVWYAFNNVAVELELSSFIAETEDINTGLMTPHLMSKTLNPTTTGLYGYQASAGLRVRIHLAPQGTVPIKEEPAITHEDQPDENTEQESIS